MSGVRIRSEEGAEGAPPPAADDEDPDVIARARRMGWKAPGEFRGDPAKAVTAQQFLDKAVDPAILADRYQVLDSRHSNLEAAHRASQAELAAMRQAQAETLDSVKALTAMSRNAEERGYKRAEAELKAQREAAVQGGDTAAFAAADAALDELKMTKPTPAAAAPAQQQTPPTQQHPAPTQQQQGAPDLAVVAEWVERNPYYQMIGHPPKAEGNPQLTLEADGMFNGIKAANPQGNLSQWLEETGRRMRLIHPNLPGSTPPQETRTNEPASNPRRSEPGAVSPASGGGAPRAPAKYTWDTMPQDSKDSYTKYAKQLEGHGEPLTKKEWAETYWGQFQDNGA